MNLFSARCSRRRRAILVFLSGLIATVVALNTVAAPFNDARAELIAGGGVDASDQSGIFLIELQPLSGGFTRPVAIAHAGDERLFIAEQEGLIWILNPDNTVSPVPFLDISDQVESENNWEQGLLGLAFHPEYRDNGYFYVNYIATDGDTHVARFRVSDMDANRADRRSERTVLVVEQPEPDHNAGDLHFGPDGYLYVALGDGGSHRSWPNAQDGSSLLGKILRIDVDGETSYGIPADNPFVGHPAMRDEIWVMGLRNPWRFSFDSATGDLFIGDVGTTQFEEVNYLAAGSSAGVNYGWPCYEGDVPFFTDLCESPDALTFPIGSYSNNETTCAVVGGFVYRGNEWPLMQGHYLFADFCSGRFWSLLPDKARSWRQRWLGDTGTPISALGEGPTGELYAAGHASGMIYRVVAVPLPYQVFLPAVFRY